MEFHERLQGLRKDRGLTQEELAKALFVSRTAVSKWESGRGYPNIESLKDLAAFFSVSIDELLSSEDILTLAEKDKKESIKKFAALICGALDALHALLLFAPVFGMKTDPIVSASVFSLTGIALWEQIMFLGIISLTSLNGLCCLILLHFEKPDLCRYVIMTGMALSSIGSIIFIAARQPYAGMVYFILFLIKVYLLAKAK